MHSQKIAVTAPDRGIAAALQHKIDQKTKPLGALGHLERVAFKVGLVQQTLTPKLSNPQIIVFAGDHGAAKAGVSAFPQEVTWQMVENFLAGGAGINVFARQNGLGLTVVDAGVAHDFGTRPGLVNAKVAPGTRNYIEEPAMTAEECAAAMEHGAGIVRALAKNGCNVVGFGEMGIGNTAAASLITHCLTGASLDDCVGRGTGLDDAGLSRKRALLEKALVRAGEVKEPLAVLAQFGGFEIAMMAGAMIAAAQAGMVLLIDGFIVGSAALVAARLTPALVDYCVFCHRSAEPGHRGQLAALDAEPVLDLGLRLGEGTGAALAYPLVQASVNFLNEMASFESAGLARKRVLLEKALARAGEVKEPLAVLAQFGGFEIAMMAGAMIAAAQAGMVLLIDGFIVGSAALVAARLAPALTDYCVFCHRSAEPGHRAQLAALDAEPFLDLGLRLGEGTGAALAYPLVQASVNFLNEMASFESAGVSEQC